MAISDQIIRLQSAKIDMKTAIENFNISIPNNAKLDTYNDYIRLISMDANAASKDILNGKTAYVGGQKINGTALSIATSANNATIFNGFTAYDSNGQLLTGNALATTTNATNNHILKGYTAYNSAGALLNGTAFGNSTNATNAQILSGKSAYLNNGVWLNGTMTNRGTLNITPSSSTQNFSSGYYSAIKVQKVPAPTSGTVTLDEWEDTITISVNGTPKGLYIAIQEIVLSQNDGSYGVMYAWTNSFSSGSYLGCFTYLYRYRSCIDEDQEYYELWSDEESQENGMCMATYDSAAATVTISSPDYYFCPGVITYCIWY